MARRRSNIVPFPGHGADGLVLSDADHAFITSAIGPCHGRGVAVFLANAPAVAGGRCLDINHPMMVAVLDAVGVEVHGYMKLDEERDGRTRVTPKRGSTAERLQAIYDLIEGHLS